MEIKNEVVYQGTEDEDQQTQNLILPDQHDNLSSSNISIDLHEQISSLSPYKNVSDIYRFMELSRSAASISITGTSVFQKPAESLGDHDANITVLSPVVIAYFVVVMKAFTICAMEYARKYENVDERRKVGKWLILLFESMEFIDEIFQKFIISYTMAIRLASYRYPGENEEPGIDLQLIFFFGCLAAPALYALLTSRPALKLLSNEVQNKLSTKLQNTAKALLYVLDNMLGVYTIIGVSVKITNIVTYVFNKNTAKKMKDFLYQHDRNISFVNLAISGVTSLFMVRRLIVEMVTGKPQEQSSRNAVYIANLVVLGFALNIVHLSISAMQDKNYYPLIMFGSLAVLVIVLCLLTHVPLLQKFSYKAISSMLACCSCNLNRVEDDILGVTNKAVKYGAIGDEINNKNRVVGISNLGNNQSNIWNEQFTAEHQGGSVEQQEKPKL